MTRPKFLYIILTQPTNLGDLIINKSYVDELSNFGDVFIDDKNVPENFRIHLYEKENVYPLSKILPDSSLKGLKFYKVLFSKTKFDFFVKSPGPFSIAFTKRVIFNNIIFLFYVFIFKLRNIKTILFGSEYKYYDWLSKIYLRSLSNNVFKISSRSKTNISYLNEIGIDNVFYSPDMCLSLDIDSHKAEVSNQQIGISFRSDPSVPDLHNNILEIINESLDKNYKVFVFYQVESDKEFNKNLYKAYENNSNVVFREECLWYDDLKIYNNFKSVCSNRLHVLLLGLIFGAYPVALINPNRSFGKKIFQVFNSLNLTQNIISKKNSWSYFLDKNESFENLTIENKKLIKKNISGCFTSNN